MISSNVGVGLYGGQADDPHRMVCPYVGQDALYEHHFLAGELDLEVTPGPFG